MSIVELYQTLSDFGFAGLMAFFIFGIHRGWIILPREFDRLQTAYDKLSEKFDELNKAHIVLTDQMASSVKQILEALPRRKDGES